jgi:hypothetical protein
VPWFKVQGDIGDRAAALGESCRHQGGAELLIDISEVVHSHVRPCIAMWNASITPQSALTLR